MNMKGNLHLQPSKITENNSKVDDILNGLLITRLGENNLKKNQYLILRGTKIQASNPLKQDESNTIKVSSIKPLVLDLGLEILSQGQYFNLTQ